MQNSLPKWMEASGVRGYGYRGKSYLRADHGHAVAAQQPRTVVRSRFVAALFVLLKLPIVACRGDRAVDRYHTRYPWLYRVVMTIIVTASLATIVIICLLP